MANSNASNAALKKVAAALGTHPSGTAHSVYKGTVGLGAKISRDRLEALRSSFLENLK
jgi:hypothetical protein